MTAIHIKFPALTLKAGPRALARIRDHGLSAAQVGTLPGAAGGPKALGIQGLDPAPPKVSAAWASCTTPRASPRA